MSAIDRDSLAWIGFSTLWRSLNVAEKEIEHRWLESAIPQKMNVVWEAVAEAIAEEAVKRYEAEKKLLHEVVAPKPSVDILKLNAEMSGR